MIRRDLNPTPEQQGKSVAERVASALKAQTTTPTGIKDLGTEGDVVWVGSTGEPVSVKQQEAFTNQLGSDLANASSQVEQAMSDVANNNATVANVANTVAESNALVANAQANIANVQANVASVQSDVANTNANVANVANTVSATNANVANAQASIANALAIANSAQSAANSAASNAVAAITAASLAANTANTASQKADDAINVANLAQAAADGLVSASIAAPDSPPKGAIWFPLDSNGSVIGMKLYDGTQWASYVIMADQFLSPGSLGTVSIANSAVTAPIVAANAITAAKIAANAITANSLAANAVTAAKIAANAITANSLAANAVTAVAIQAGAVTANAIGANAVTASAILAGSVTSKALAANSVIAGKINANAVVADSIAAGAVTANAIGANAVTANAIAAGAVTANAIAANAVTANTIQGNAINGMTINGATIQTSPTANTTGGSRMDGTGIHTYDSTGVETTRLNGASNFFAGTTQAGLAWLGDIGTDSNGKRWSGIFFGNTSADMSSSAPGMMSCVDSTGKRDSFLSTGGTDANTLCQVVVSEQLAETQITAGNAYAVFNTNGKINMSDHVYVQGQAVPVSIGLGNTYAGTDDPDSLVVMYGGTCVFQRGGNITIYHPYKLKSIKAVVAVNGDASAGQFAVGVTEGTTTNFKMYAHLWTGNGADLVRVNYFVLGTV